MNVPGLLSRVGWHFAFWGSAISAASITKSRLTFFWEESLRDSSASDSIIRHFEASWEEGNLLRRTLLEDLHRKLDSIFILNKLMEELESVAAGQLPESSSRVRKLEIWEKLKIEVISRILVGIYSSSILTEFTTVALAMVGKALYLRGLLKEHSAVSAEELSSANRVFVCLAARFVQHGTSLLVESVRNIVMAVFGKVSLQEPISKASFDSLVNQVRHEVESACGKSVLDDAIFGKMDELISGDLSSTKRRLFISMVSEARSRMKSKHVHQALCDQIHSSLEEIYSIAFDGKIIDPSPPMISVIPKLSTFYHKLFKPSSTNQIIMRRIAASIFVDGSSDIYNYLLRV